MLDGAAYWRHMALLFMALYASSAQHESWAMFHKSRSSRMRRYAMGRKARAVVLFDRVLTDPNSEII